MKKTIIISLFATKLLFSQTIQLAEFYYENGLPKDIRTYKQTRNRLELIKKTFFYESGQKEKEGSCKYGKKDGKWTEWRLDGTRTVEGMFKDSEKHGQWTYWYRNGQKDRERSYFHGEKDEKWIKRRPKDDRCWKKTYEQRVQIGMGLLY